MTDLKCTRCGVVLQDYSDVAYDGPKDRNSKECSQFVKWETFCRSCNEDTQPAPKKNDNPAIWDIVIADMKNRDKVGRKRYGTPLQPNNGRDMLLDTYEELLDACAYIRGVLYERDGH